MGVLFVQNSDLFFSCLLLSSNIVCMLDLLSSALRFILFIYMLFVFQTVYNEFVKLIFFKYFDSDRNWRHAVYYTIA